MELWLAKKINDLFNGKTVKLSYAEIAKAVVNLEEAERNLTASQYCAVRIQLEKCLRNPKNNKKSRVNFDEYMKRYISIMLMFDTIAPYELYCGADRNSEEFKAIVELLEEMRRNYSFLYR